MASSVTGPADALPAKATAAGISGGDGTGQRQRGNDRASVGGHDIERGVAGNGGNERDRRSTRCGDERQRQRIVKAGVAIDDKPRGHAAIASIYQSLPRRQSLYCFQ